MNLRSAAEAVWVLDVFFVAANDVAAIRVATYGLCGLELSFVWTHHMEAFVEWLYAAIESVEAKTKDHVGLLAETLCFEKTPHCIAAHELCSVEEG